MLAPSVALVIVTTWEPLKLPPLGEITGAATVSMTRSASSGALPCLTIVPSSFQLSMVILPVRRVMP